MNKVGKITAKHFINKTLKVPTYKNEIIDSNGKSVDITPPFHPLYIKITFQRTTTQMKSLLNLDFTSVEEAEFRCGDWLDMEKKMINDIIKSEFKKNGDKFILKGIPDKCKPFGQPLKDFFPGMLLVDIYNTMVLNSKSSYLELLEWKSSTIPAMVYYEAALKLLGELPQLIALKEKFDLCDHFEKAISNNNTGILKVLEWKYGDAKEQFSQKALSAGLSFNQLVGIVTNIDELIDKLI